MKVDACWALSYLAGGGEMLIQVGVVNTEEEEEYLGQMAGRREDMILPSLLPSPFSSLTGSSG